MRVRQLKYFVATAESGQVSRAAVSLSVSQSSVTTAIRELEADIGLRLFERSPQGMELTPPGRELLAVAYEVLAKIEEARNLRYRASPVSGTLTVAATYTVIGYFLPYHLGRLRRLHPDLTINLHELNREAIEEGLMANRFDLAVLLTSNITTPELDTETLFRSPRRLWVGNSHRFSQRRKVTMEEIAQEDYILLTVDEAAHSSMKYWSLQKAQPRIKLRTSSIEAVRSMVADHQGVTILSDMVYRPWSLEGKRLHTVQTDYPVPSMDVGLAWQRNTEFSPALQLVYDYFRRSFIAPQI
ncbi:MAG: Transcriptional regulator [Rhodobacteraceae bacterium HLUCCA12]|nr:MAG: Transcriptional regulator [Rhodobacteraceae bacterium HLUCCA12]